MNYFGRELMGGAINSAGFSEQDCASIVFLFKYLDDDSFNEISFETIDDFTIRFNNKKEIKVQVKINQFTIKFVSDLLKKYKVNENKDTVFIGSSFDDGFRNLFNKIERYKNAINSSCSEKEKIIKEAEQECRKKAISLDKITKVAFYTIDKLNSVNIAQNAIYEWADNRRIFLDVKGVMAELVMKIALHLRENGGSLSKEEVINIIYKYKQSKISSISNCKEKSDDKKYIIDIIEEEMIRKPIFFDKLQALKHEIELGMFIEALNHAEEIYRNNNEFIDTYMWILTKNNKYEEVIELCNRYSQKSNFALYLLGDSYFNINRLDESITVFEQLKTNNDSFEVNMALSRCFKEKNIEKTKEYLGYCLKFEPKNELAYLELGKLYKFSQESIEYLNKALLCNSKFAEAYLEKGLYYRYIGRFDEAINCFEKYIELNDNLYDSSVLFELAMSVYKANKEEKNIHISRWVDRLINFDLYQRINIDNNYVVIDIGYDYTNYIIISKKVDDIQIIINEDFIMNIHNVRSQSGIGLYVSPVNFQMAHFVKEENEITNLLEEASLPAFFKTYDTMKDYMVTKDKILQENVMVMNHEIEGYLEYCVEEKDIKVNIYKRLNSLDATIQIGNYVIDEMIPSTGEGFQNFRRKLQGGSMFNEAAVVLMGPNEVCQITFQSKIIDIFDK